MIYYLLMKFRKSVYEVIDSDSNKTGIKYKIDDYFISGLIILNVFAIILESYQDLYSQYKSYFHLFDLFSIIIFTIEYLLRIWSAPEKPGESKALTKRLKYIFSPLGIVDLLAILPFYLPFFVTLDLRFIRILRLLRLFRIFKLAHYSHSLRIIGVVLKKQRYELLITLVGTFMVILISSSLMYEIEHHAQPDKFPNIFATFWWAIATLTTIGYGDVFPVTGWGQFLAAITALFGIGLVAIPTGIISMGFLEEVVQKRRKKKPEQSIESHPYNYCPHCGQKLKD